LKQPVCLITPPSVFLLDERVFMSLGILRVAAVLEQEGYPVELLDLSGISNFEEAARDHANVSKAKVFGLTATSPQMPAALSIRNTIAQVRPDARFVLGGPHVTLTNAARKQQATRKIPGRAVKAFEQLAASFDVLVAGDGEEAIFQSLADDCPKLIDADEPKSPLFLTSSRLEELPLAARHLVDVNSYHYYIDGVRALSLICQLGCPFGCRFCGGRASPSLRRMRLRSTASVIAEIGHLYEAYGVNGFMLYDDELNVNPRMSELMRDIGRKAKELGVEFRLRGFVKAELFTDQQAAAMYDAGFRWILTGFESGSPRILRNINKQATVEDNTRCMEIARRNGLKVKALMSVGHPGESAETIAETHQWLLNAKVDDFDMTIISVYPGSPYYDHAEAYDQTAGVWVYTVNGDRLYSYEVDYTTVSNYYKGDPESGYMSYVYTDHLTATEIVRFRDQAETDVRQRLSIPLNSSAAAIQYEHSMGQHGTLPQHMLRKTSQVPYVAATAGASGLVQIQASASS
jgi:radical SAM superfamily enzyme YgiQ (UPF0313 family)